MTRPRKKLPFPCPACKKTYGGPINYTAYKTEEYGVAVYVRIKHDNKWCSIKLNPHHMEQTTVNGVPISEVFDLPGNENRKMLNYKIDDDMLEAWRDGYMRYISKGLQ